jgi:hypothetical protein
MVVKDVVKSFGVTSDKPAVFGGTSATFEEYKGTSVPERLSSDSDRPNEEAVSQDVLDGRSVQASVENVFSQMIFEESDTDTVFDTFKAAADENQVVWLRRDGLQTEADAEIIGGELGLTCTIAKQRPGRDGHRMFVVNFSAVGAFGGDTIVPEGSGS